MRFCRTDFSLKASPFPISLELRSDDSQAPLGTEPGLCGHAPGGWRIPAAGPAATGAASTARGTAARAAAARGAGPGLAAARARPGAPALPAPGPWAAAPSAAAPRGAAPKVTGGGHRGDALGCRGGDPGHPCGAWGAGGAAREPPHRWKGPGLAAERAPGEGTLLWGHLGPALPEQPDTGQRRGLCASRALEGTGEQKDTIQLWL